MGLQGFYSHAPKDEPLLAELKTHLSALQQQGLEMWDAGRILAGEAREEALSRRLEEADLVLLLISADFLASETCQAQLQRAMERHHAGDAHVVPILVRPVDVRDTPLEGLTFLPTNGRPVKSWKDTDDAWLEVVKGIRALVEELLRSRVTANPGVALPEWAPVPSALAQALGEYKRARAEEPRMRRLDLRGLAGIAQGSHQTELDLLDFAVAPSLHDETEGESERAAELRRRLRHPHLAPERRREILTELTQLQTAQWDHFKRDSQRRLEPISFAEALHRHRRLTVIGDPGAGKSILTRLAFLACTDGEAGDRARALLGDDDGSNRPALRTVGGLGELLPIRITLHALGRALAKGEQESLQGFVQWQLKTQGARPLLAGYLDELLSEGRLLLLCDGLDEVPEELRASVVNKVSGLLEQYPAVRLVLTSRPNGYRPRVPGIAHTRLAPLHERQKRYLVSRLHELVETRRQPDARGIERARRRTSALLHALQTRRDWDQLGNNPLLLTLSALTPTGEDGVPRHRVFVFENFVRTLVGEWRAALLGSRAQAEVLLDVWSTVASELVKQVQHHGTLKEGLLQLLASTLAGRQETASLDARTALTLALETGLVREEDETAAFWHATFAEFLAARALSGNGLTVKGAAKRILAAENLPSLVLELAAARLDHVLANGTELHELVEGLLTRDQAGMARLVRPGLVAVSGCLARGVSFAPADVERVWTAWAELLEQTPISPLWEVFGRFAQQAPQPDLPVQLVKRFALIPDRGISEVMEGLARIVAPLASPDPEVRAACERWHRQPDATLNRLGALGLVFMGEWPDAVIEKLGSFASASTPSPARVGAVVRSGGQPLLTRLRELVASTSVRPRAVKPTSFEEAEERKVRDLRLSAACLLAVSGNWNDAVAEALKQTLAGHHRVDEAQELMRMCADERQVAEALLDWIRDESTLGNRARELARDVAPLIEDMPGAVLELTAGAQGALLGELEKLLASIGEERRSLLGTLHRWLVDPREERRWCAARVLLRLAPRDSRLQEALRQGMRSPDEVSRVSWTHLALGMGPGLSALAREVLLSGACSADKQVRQRVYIRLLDWMTRWEWKPLEDWLACAENRQLPDAARLDAVTFVSYRLVSSLSVARVMNVLRDLLDAQDAEVRKVASFRLLLQGRVDERTAVVAVEEMARSGINAPPLRMLARATSLASVIVQTVLRELSARPRSANAGEPPHEHLGWTELMRELAAAEPSCVQHLLHALELPGAAGDVAEDALSGLIDKQSLVRNALRERLDSAAAELKPCELLRLINLSLSHEETTPAAVSASRNIDVHRFTPSELFGLPYRLRRGGAEVDAERIGRHMLDGENARLVLRTAKWLVDEFVEGANAWVRPALMRLLHAPDVSLRLDAARLALRCSILQTVTRAVLFNCTHRRREKYIRDDFLGLHWSPERMDHGRPLRVWPPRIDFEAMHLLCEYWPELGLRRLTPWLEDAEHERFRGAVQILAGRREFQEQVRAALASRLGSVPVEQLPEVVRLVMSQGLSSVFLFEHVLSRYDPELPSSMQVRDCLHEWLSEEPSLWAVIPRLELTRLAGLSHLLHPGMAPHPELIRFAVKYVLSNESALRINEAYLFSEPSMNAWRMLGSWYESPASEDPIRGVHPGDSTKEQREEVVRGWLRDVLAELPDPTEVFALLLLARLLEWSHDAMSRRIGVLRRVLEASHSATEDTDASLREHLETQVRAARELLALGTDDERIPSVLEAAVHAFASAPPAPFMATAFEVANTLLDLRPANAAIRRSLHAAVLHAGESFNFDFDMMLAVLERAGFSRDERIGMLTERLESVNEDKEFLVPQLLDALAKLDCAPERRTELLREFVSKHDEAFSADARLALAKRPELSDPTAARLLLSVIPQRRQFARQAVEQWLSRFAAVREETSKTEKAMRWWLWSSGDSTSVTHYLLLLRELSETRQPKQMDALICELVRDSSTKLFALYSRSRSGAELSPSEWNELMDWLTLEPGDTATEVLAKNWLSLGLWQVADPERLQMVLNG